MQPKSIAHAFLLILAGTVAWSSGLAASEPSQPSAAVVVVRPAQWHNSLSEWVNYRTNQGFEVVELDSQPDAAAIREQIRALATSGQLQSQLKCVVLVGDTSPAKKSQGIKTFPNLKSSAPNESSLRTPTFYKDSEAMVQFGCDPVIASDNPYGDLDGDDQPELAVGRISVDNEEQLRTYLNRVMSYEQKPSYAPWRRNVHIVAGIGGFGPVADTIIEMTTRSFLSERIPGWSRLTMTQASTDSNYCPDPWKFSESCIERLNEGGMFWVYIGHGHVRNLDYVRAAGRWLPIMTSADVPLIKTERKSPIAIFLCCYTGAYDMHEDSLAEELVLNPNGPIACLAASRVSGPYGLAMLSNGLIERCYEQRVGSLGEVVQLAKRQMFEEPSEDEVKASSSAKQLKFISSIAKSMSPAGYELLQERREHVWQMNLLGDPLLQIKHPDMLDMQVPEKLQPGEELILNGNAEVAGTLNVEVALRRGRLTAEAKDQQVGLTSQAGLQGYQKRYEAANDTVVMTIKRSVEAGDFRFSVPMPELKSGRYAVRGFLEGTEKYLVSYHVVSIKN